MKTLFFYATVVLEERRDIFSIKTPVSRNLEQKIRRAESDVDCSDREDWQDVSGQSGEARNESGRLIELTGGR